MVFNFLPNKSKATMKAIKYFFLIAEFLRTLVGNSFGADIRIACKLITGDHYQREELVNEEVG